VAKRLAFRIFLCDNGYVIVFTKLKTIKLNQKGKQMSKIIRRNAPTSALTQPKLGFLFLGTTLLVAFGAVFL
jgi:hypothetical protein